VVLLISLVPANHATQESHYALVVYALLTVLLSAKITPTAVEDLVTAHLISPRMVPALLTQASCTSNYLRYLDCTRTTNSQNTLNVCGDKYKNYRCCLRNLNLVPSKDLTLAYCSSATFAQASVVVMAVVALVVMF
jgi:hypothetical protein